MSEDIKSSHNELFETILKLSSVKDCEEFFSDLCTEREIDAMTQRVKAGKMLKDGATYEKIISSTEISSTTLSRVSRALKYGEGYKKFL